MIILNKSYIETNYCCEIFTNFTMKKVEIDDASHFSSVQFSRSVVSDSLRLHESEHARPPIHHQFPEFTQIHVPWIGDAIQQSHPLMPSSSALNLSRHQGLFQWVSCSYQKTKILEFQLQYQSFQWIFKIWFCIVFLKKSTQDSISLRPHISWICPDTWHRACISLVSWCTTMRSPCQ